MFLARVVAAQGTQPGVLGTGDPNRNPPPNIKIGIMTSLTGGNASFGKSMTEGIEIAIEQQNKRPLLGGKIEFVIADNESQTNKVRVAVLKLIEQDQVCAILGDVASGRTAAAAPDAMKNKIPLLTPSATRPDLTEMGNYVFRACVPDNIQALWMVELAGDKLKAKKAAILTDSQNPYSLLLTQSLREELKKKEITLVAEATYTASDRNFEKPLTTIRDAQPDIILLPGYYSEVVTMVPQARKLKIQVPFIGSDAWDAEETLAIGKDAMNGCYFVTHAYFNDPNPGVQEFIKAYKARFNGQTPDATAMCGYDAANLLFDAIRRAGSTDGSKIREALATTNNFPALYGPISFDKDRVTTRPGVVIKIENQKFKFFSRIGEPKAPAPPGGGK